VDATRLLEVMRRNADDILRTKNNGCNLFGV
jgi:hypothetical protein